MNMSDAALRYVVLRHEGVPDPHFDLMFETSPGSPLATWRSPAWPIAEDMPLTPLADHRRDYLTYEGPVSGGRGSVRRVAEGFHRVRRNDLEKLIVEVQGDAVITLPRSRD
jgi:hypothetical protein